MTVLGIDVGGTKVAAALFRESGEVLAREVAALAGRGGTAVGALVRDVAGRDGTSRIPLNGRTRRRQEAKTRSAKLDPVRGL